MAIFLCNLSLFCTYCISLFLSSFYNTKEVKLVVVLLKLLGKHAATRKEKQMRVGIITPYKAQKLRIQQALEEEPKKEFKNGIQ